MFDLKDLKADPSKTIDVTIKHPKTGEPIVDTTGVAITITVVGQDSPEFKRVAKAQQQARLTRTQRTGKMALNVDELNEESLDQLTACVKGWVNITFRGQALEPTPENIRMVLTEVPIIREQIDAAISDRAAFLGNS